MYSSFGDLFIVPNISLPSRISGIALHWTRVGTEKFCCATACRRRASRPRELKFDGFLEAFFVSTIVGISCSSSLRFMVALGRKTIDTSTVYGFCRFIDFIDFELENKKTIG